MDEQTAALYLYASYAKQTADAMAKSILRSIVATNMCMDAQLKGKLECEEHGKLYKRYGWLHRHFRKHHA